MDYLLTLTARTDAREGATFMEQMDRLGRAAKALAAHGLCIESSLIEPNLIPVTMALARMETLSADEGRGPAADCEH